MNRLLATKQPARPIAVAEGILVTLIWASSFVFVKVVLDHLGPLTVAGLRYSLAFLMLHSTGERGTRMLCGNGWQENAS
jgi:drug/metabolite transporter (DMT)-like permease